MAASLPPSVAGAGDGDGSSLTTTPNPAAPSASRPPSLPSKAASPMAASASASASAQPAAVPIRDKEAFNKVLVDRFVTRDWIHSSALKDSDSQLRTTTRDTLTRINAYKAIAEQHSTYNGRLFGEGYIGYGNGYTDTSGPTKIVYPSQKPRAGRRAAPQLKFSRKDIKKQAEQHEELVPVRIDVDWDKVKLRDTFTFNLHERLMPVDVFAAHLVEDMGLKGPLEKPVYEQVVQQMHEQLNDFYPFAYSDEEALDPELPYSAYKNDEMRILIKLNITIGAHTLVDQFEWEINNPMNSPEEFAVTMARDLSLSGEFATAIAHCIREQAQLFTRSLYSIGHPFDGRPIEDPDLTIAFLPSPLPAVFRPQQQAKDYAPYLYENTEAELERSETMFSREQRRQKRSVNRRGGPQLPDLKERQRTIRTSIVSSVLPGAAADIEESRLFKRAVGVGGIAGRSKRPARDGDISDSEDSEDSAPDSPAMSQLQGTARTRGIMRGAASVAAHRMANLGRSETPETIIHHHETRTSRRVGREATREETEELQHVVTLKVTPARLKKLLRDLKLKQSAQGPPGSATPAGQSHQRAGSASAAPGSMGPPSTPSGTNKNLPIKSTMPWAARQAYLGGVPAPPPGQPGEPQPPPPPIPEWLSTALQRLQRLYPNDQFKAFMRYCAMNTKTDTVAAMPRSPDMPPDVEIWWVPRIKCLDCPGKSYTPGPERSTDNFEVHLKNRLHRAQVDNRLESGGRLPPEQPRGLSIPSASSSTAANGTINASPVTPVAPQSTSAIPLPPLPPPKSSTS
ncbi:SNF5-like protein [Lasiosphaeria ovina]|uniref:SNF5-like protein n=1 Tax=Lasiosphaeria ovina TaxID=92902 RepID=A0AAE0TTE4_9PEZI|nr:SNF5-like protein [Lasiosphaeria ovina]